MSKKIEENEKLQLLLLASQYQNLTMQIQILQRDLLTAQQEVAKKGNELTDFRNVIAEKYEVDLTKETLNSNGEFIPMPANLPFQVQKGE